MHLCKFKCAANKLEDATLITNSFFVILFKTKKCAAIVFMLKSHHKTTVHYRRHPPPPYGSSFLQATLLLPTGKPPPSPFHDIFLHNVPPSRLPRLSNANALPHPRCQPCLATSTPFPPRYHTSPPLSNLVSHSLLHYFPPRLTTSSSQLPHDLPLSPPIHGLPINFLSLSHYYILSLHLPSRLSTQLSLSSICRPCSKHSFLYKQKPHTSI